ncbi:hypothetical protein HDU87_001357 [Geranomyces variabilis]|uniref:Uncharacterized protein n=1 Tax=Geranomyces variabilis TaxID=109894 RepID=A0AAD5TPN4_9FUNG|nr:hypothetical protein HDU87_001357 [Geranomyces variabilis]
MTQETTTNETNDVSFCPSFELADQIVGYLWLDITIHLRTTQYLSLARINHTFKSVLYHPRRRNTLMQAQAAALLAGGHRTFKDPLTNPFLPALEFLATLAGPTPEVLARLWVAHRARVNELIPLLDDGAAMFRLAPTGHNKRSTMLSATGCAKIRVAAAGWGAGSGVLVGFLRNVRTIKVAGAMDAFVTVWLAAPTVGRLYLIRKDGAWTGPWDVIEFAHGFPA